MGVERVVLDTNVWLSGLLWRGTPYQCVLMARGGIVHALTCQPLLDELADKLATPFGFSPPRAQQAVAEIERMAEIVQVTGALSGVVADPDDDIVIECAAAGRAAYIVSGDKHLLALAEYGGIVIVPPAGLLRVLRR